MKIAATIAEVRDGVRTARRDGNRIGLVPTMGALHAGHGALIERAVADCGFTVVSIFVNPTQFGPNEDFACYPRTFQEDTAYCEKLAVDVVFAPTPQEMYPCEPLTWVNVEKLTDGLCGAARPGHFRGVTTVCAKLFNIITPDIAYFGQKDAQQAIVIQRMVADLNIPLEICVCPTIREADGLAVSSRNRYLSPDQRRRAVCLFQALGHCRKRAAEGDRYAGALVKEMRDIIERAGGQVDYVSIVDAETLESVDVLGQHNLVALAVTIGTTRLIDNCTLDLNAGSKGV